MKFSIPSRVWLTSPVAVVMLISLFMVGCSSEQAVVVVQEISQQVLLSSPPQDVLILDVRSPGEFHRGHVPSAVNIPHGELAVRFPELGTDVDRPIVLYCKSGRRASIAASVLQGAGFTDLHHLTGDMTKWIARGRPVE